jgi:hypothetical protein
MHLFYILQYNNNDQKSAVKYFLLRIKKLEFLLNVMYTCFVGYGIKDR